MTGASALDALLSPRSIAVVGASEGPRHGGEVMRALRASRYGGRVVPVNPGRARVYGLACAASLSAMDAPVDCAVLAVGRDQVLGCLAEAAGRGVRAAVIVSGGFKESGPEGARLEAGIADFVRRTGIRVLGPNTIGFINVAGQVGCYAASLPVGLSPGIVGAAVQSGTVCGALGGAGRGLRFSHLVATGNETDVSAADLVAFFAQDPATRVISLFSESIKDGPAFMRAAEQARRAGKPIVMLKTGRSDAAQRMSATHTGSLADSPRVLRAMMRRYGIIQVETLSELITTTELVAALIDRLPVQGGFGVMTHSGGEAAILLDLADRIGLRLPDLSPDTVELLRTVLPSYAAPQNPLDVTGVGAVDGAVFRACLETLLGDPNLGLVAVMQDARAGHWVLKQAATLTAEVGRVSKTPVVFFSNTSRHFEPELDDILAAGRVPFLYGTREVLSAVASVLNGGGAPVGCAEAPVEGASARRALSQAGRDGGTGLLALAGIGTARQVPCATAEAAEAAAAAIGYPVALKIDSPDIVHKTEAGGVALGIASPQALRDTVATMLDQARRHAPEAELRGVLVQEMIAGPVAEIIVSVERDPVYGPFVMCGLGGLFAEILDDVAIRLAPVGIEEAREMVEELRAAPLLKGARGRPAADHDALARAISGLSRLGCALEEEADGIEINPLLVLPEGCGVRAVDLVVTRPNGHASRSELHADAA